MTIMECTIATNVVQEMRKIKLSQGHFTKKQRYFMGFFFFGGGGDHLISIKQIIFGIPKKFLMF